MSRQKNELYQSGITTDGKPIMAGIFSFYETHGLPLDVILITFIEKGWVPDWVEFYETAISAGMKHDRILSKLEEAISDSFGKEWNDVVISKLHKMFNNKETK